MCNFANMMFPKIENVEGKCRFLCWHLGFAIFLISITFGFTHIKKLTMAVAEGQTECRAQDSEGKVAMLEFNVRLNRFEVAADNFVSSVDVLWGDERDLSDRQISVNHPLETDGWKIYQYDYAEPASGDAPAVTVLMLVSDPWLPYLYAGIFLLLAGAVMSLARPRRLLFVGIIGVATIILKYTYFDHVQTPALHSPWFAPHVVVYMGCYLSMTLALLLALHQLIAKHSVAASAMRRIDSLVAFGIPLMTIGMLLGALWAKESWGVCWSWDPKETLAAVTWLLFLAYSHLRHYRPARRGAAIALLIVAYLCLQMCWWGINLISSWQASSLHVYDI